MAAAVSAVGKIRAIDVAVRNHDGRGSVCYFEEGNANGALEEDRLSLGYIQTFFETSLFLRQTNNDTSARTDDLFHVFSMKESSMHILRNAAKEGGKRSIETTSRDLKRRSRRNRRSFSKKSTSDGGPRSRLDVSELRAYVRGAVTERKLHDVDVVVRVDENGVDRRQVKFIGQIVLLNLPGYRIRISATSFRQNAGGSVDEELAQFDVRQIEVWEDSQGLAHALP
ncbi:3-phosphoinositide-dependent protein kinase 1 isoform X1 [Vespula squamosa]|uniref:3-phosphoinositide-dependent protein kinase 1 isoform X1 n=1 Tax=Vespula squamosa TaxID=30214 RepID=A0ABD2C8B4_VESSQ